MDAAHEERAAIQAATDRAALDELLATLSPHQVQQMTSAMLALGAMNREPRNG